MSVEKVLLTLKILKTNKHDLNFNFQTSDREGLAIRAWFDLLQNLTIKNE